MCALLIKKSLLCLILLFISPYEVLAKKTNIDIFTEIEINTEFNLTHPVMAIDLLPEHGKEIVTFSVDSSNENWVTIYKLQESNLPKQKGSLKEISRTKLPKKFYSFDITTYHKATLQTLYFLSSDSLYKFVLDDQTHAPSFKLLHSVSTIAIGEQEQYLSKGNFLVDINNDGQDITFLSDFTHIHLYSQKENVTNKVSLPIKPQAIFNSFSAEYKKTQLYFSDINLDALTDVLYAEQGRLVYFTQNTDSSISTSPEYITIDDTINGIDWWEKRDSNGEKLDQSNLVYRRIEQIKDINNDNITDMIVRFTQSEGVLDKTNDYEVYLGYIENGKLRFSKKTSSTIKGDGTLTDFKTVDINQDDKYEILVSGFKLGISQIIGALLSGSIDQDVHLFYMDEQGMFHKNLKISKEVELEFSLSSGTSGNPLVMFTDINGDGLKDLLLSEDNDSLLIYLGNTTNKRLSKKPMKYKVMLPNQGEIITTEDINEDGKYDLIIKYGRDDNASRKSFKILLAN